MRLDEPPDHLQGHERFIRRQSLAEQVEPSRPEEHVARAQREDVHPVDRVLHSHLLDEELEVVVETEVFAVRTVQLGAVVQHRGDEALERIAQVAEVHRDADQDWDAGVARAETVDGEQHEGHCYDGTHEHAVLESEGWYVNNTPGK